MDDRTKGLGERGLGDEQVTGRGDVARGPGAYESPGRADERRTTAPPPAGTAPRAAGRPPTPDQETRKIRADIERTREDLSETIDAIQDRLRPSHIASTAVSSVREAANERIHDVAESDFIQDLRANPTPTIMVGIGIVGLAWLMFSRGEHDRYRSRRYRGTRGAYGYYDDDVYPGDRDRTPYGSDVYGAYGSSGEASVMRGSRYSRGTGAEGAGDDARGAAHRAEDYARETARSARQTTRRARSTLQRMLDENPLMVGAAAAAIGAAIGAALPETERENELMGEARDSMIENVQSKAQETVERVQHAATEATEHVQHAAAEAIGLGGQKEEKDADADADKDRGGGAQGGNA